MLHANVPRFLWSEAFHSAVHIINKLSTTSNTNIHMRFFTAISQLSPSQGFLLHGVCTAHQRDKLLPKLLDCAFIGYNDFPKGYRCYCRDSKKARRGPRNIKKGSPSRSVDPISTVPFQWKKGTKDVIIKHGVLQQGPIYNQTPQEVDVDALREEWGHMRSDRNFKYAGRSSEPTAGRLYSCVFGHVAGRISNSCPQLAGHPPQSMELSSLPSAS